MHEILKTNERVFFLMISVQGRIQRGGPGGPDPPPPLPKYQTPSNLNTRTTHGPSTVRDGLQIAPNARRLFVDRQEPEKLLKLPRYSNFGTVCCTGNFKHELFVVCTVNYTDDER